jgi:hypothetical protein
MKKTLLAIGFASSTFFATAQDNETTGPREKKFDHSVGVQMNGLIKQVFNFGNANNAVNNPYLLNYTLNLRKSGWGVRVGGGYNNQSFATNDGITEAESNLNNMQVRLGFEKRFQLSQKWSAGVGLDAILSNEKNTTNTITRGFDTSTVKSTSELKTKGGGAMAWLRYSITDKIQIGTEASFYQRYGTQEIKVAITERSNTFPGGNIITTITKKEHNLTDGVISLPVAIFLIVKF